MDESFNSRDSGDKELELLRELQAQEKNQNHQAISNIQEQILSRNTPASRVSKPMSTRSKLLSKVSKVSSKLSGNKIDVLSERNWKEGSVAKLLKHKKNRNPCLTTEDVLVETLSKSLAKKRQNAALVQDSNKKVIGIITDADISKRVISKHLNPDQTTVGSVMTPNPVFVQPGESIVDVFTLMCNRRFRHIPVLDESAEVVYGLLDISECLYDAIARIEKAKKKQADFIRAVQRAQSHFDANDSSTTNFLAQEMISHMMAKITPKISTVLFKNETEGDDVAENERYCILSATDSVEKACQVMAKHGKTAVIGVSKDPESELEYGIFTTKDLLNKVVSRKIAPEVIKLQDVMTKNPDSVDLDSSLLDALHMMLKGRFLHVPVVKYDLSNSGVEENESVVGILDVLDCSIHMLAALSVNSKNKGSGDEADLYNKENIDDEIEQNVFQTLYLGEMDSGSRVSASENIISGPGINESASQTGRTSVMKKALSSAISLEQIEEKEKTLAIKMINVSDGHIFRVDLKASGKKSSFEMRKLRKMVKKIIGLNVEIADLRLKYLDEDEEEVVLDSDEDLQQAVDLMSEQSWKKLTIKVYVKGTLEKLGIGAKEKLIFGVFGGILILGSFVFILSKKTSQTRAMKTDIHQYNSAMGTFPVKNWH
eukprot:maker-scaffold_6-snap-gene-15.16-mRNA-1 protein AED:0.01 eAED:0.01 QI:74/1/1/1/1/1/3/122/655